MRKSYLGVSAAIVASVARSIGMSVTIRGDDQPQRIHLPSRVSGAGTARRLKREAEYRAKEAERTKNAAPAKITRQQRRRAEWPEKKYRRKMLAKFAARLAS